VTRSIRLGIALVTLLAVGVVVAAAIVADPIASSGRARGASEEAQEQWEDTERRLIALEAARLSGVLGITETVDAAPAPGWAGERIMHRTGDDWEPAIATDPNEPYVYVMHNRYGGTPACRNCPDPAMIVHASDDGGRSWANERYLCRCGGVRGQYDPLLEVVPTTGDVYAVWMNGFNVHFARSADHARTWSRPVHVHPAVRWGDKPNFATSVDGQDVYVLFNGPTGGDVRASVSHDGGATWSNVRVTDDDRYHFAYGTAVLPDGRVVSTQISFDYTDEGGPGGRQVYIHAFSSDDGGVTWDDTIVDRLALGSFCVTRGCYDDYYDSGPALAADADGDLVIVYSGASEYRGRRTVYARSSTDGGRTWTEATRLSATGANAAFAAAAGTGDGIVEVWFGERRGGRWDVVHRSSEDLGATWSPPVKISDARSGTAYKDPEGFLEMYGDYGEVAITSAGKVVAVWGEGMSYLGPGGVWFNRER
jgi:BNR repeat-like domain